MATTRVTASLLLLVVTAAFSGCGRKPREGEAARTSASGLSELEEMDAGPAGCAESPRKAYSLKVLQKLLERAGNGGEVTGEATNLAGITWLEGYVGDRERGDIILVGRACASLPALHLDDLVVALRSAWLKYAELRGNTYYVTDPGCSIDPDETVLARLHQVEQSMNASASFEEMDARVEQWRRIAGSPQTVRILGVPFDTRFGSIAVKADYDMKSIVDGTDVVGVPGLESMMDMIQSQAREEVEAGKPVTIPSSMMNRFWFHPSRSGYREAPGTILINRCPVMLSTEEEYLASKGKLAGTGRVNAFAHRFASRFTERYRQVAEKRPVYHQLEGLFRHVALARIMRFRSSPDEVGLEMSCLLERYSPGQVPVDRTLPGRFNLKKFEHRMEQPGGYSIVKCWLPACGGVGIDVQPDKSNILPDSDGKIAGLTARVLGLRPSPDVLSWDVR